ncbi:PaaI family thioesterase [Arcanobacterium bovis]|uniref:PaaI family thioesterase n=1 Tax=Arcanobacterium bovis TaxID=2529275 RepID=A0A4Q9UYK7_9ACTO|nr:PaaI family thioesterase [Arcanobacterium bovis]TBW20742.1 PaaI family thioesterase [Arcanobacterium bovis]
MNLEDILATTANPQDRAQFFAALPDVTPELGEMCGSDVVSQGLRAHLVGADVMVCSLPVDGNRQFMGLMNGGSTALLGETTGSSAAVLAAPEGKTAVGISITVNHHLPAKEGRVYCVATKVSHTSSFVTYNFLFFRHDGKLSASGTHTCAIIDKR